MDSQNNRSMGEECITAIVAGVLWLLFFAFVGFLIAGRV